MTTKKKDKENENKEPALRGLMVHTDGAARPNPGFAGWGMHGYIYEDVSPTKGTGNPDYVLTADDYLTKAVKATLPNVPLVTPVVYVDGYGALPPMSTNNRGELLGALEALRLALLHKVQRVRIWTDSRYVIGGFSHALKWRANHWKKADGVEPANIDLWKEYVPLIEQIKTEGVDLAINWCEGHSGVLGNEMADTLAYIAHRHAVNGLYDKSIKLTSPEGYWKYDAERHPFLNHRRMYYDTIRENNVPGEYCLGEHDKDDDLAGKRMANGAYAYVLLDEPDPVLETVRNYSIKQADGDHTVMIARVDYIYRADVHSLIKNYGVVPLRPLPNTNASGLDTVIEDLKEVVTREHNPPLLIQRCFNELSQMREILDDFRNGKPDLVTTDLTSLIYESFVETNKKGEEKHLTKLRPEFVVGTSDMAAKVSYRHPDGSPRQVDIRLLLGLDLLDRNGLRRLEDLEPEVRLVTWLEEPQAFRFATIIKVKGAIGIWAGAYSNLRLILD